jgi:hypothetical protein
MLMISGLPLAALISLACLARSMTLAVSDGVVFGELVAAPTVKSNRSLGGMRGAQIAPHRVLKHRDRLQV